VNNSALEKLTNLDSPIVVDGGHWQFGHTYFVMTNEGVMTLDTTSYEPVFGPFTVTEKMLAEANERAENADIAKLVGNGDIRTEEALVILNKGAVDTKYWAYIPHEDAPLNEWVLSLNYKEIEKLLLDDCTEMELSVERWDEMSEEELDEWADKIQME